MAKYTRAEHSEISDYAWFLEKHFFHAGMLQLLESERTVIQNK